MPTTPKETKLVKLYWTSVRHDRKSDDTKSEAIMVERVAEETAKSYRMPKGPGARWPRDYLKGGLTTVPKDRVKRYGMYITPEGALAGGLAYANRRVELAELELANAKIHRALLQRLHEDYITEPEAVDAPGV